MSSRKIQHPGIELNEIDRSQYEKTDNSLPGSPNTLHFGFAPKGEDYALQWIDSKTTFEDIYGIPVTEYEKYFYNAAMEVLNKGGTCIAAKLPYDNNSKDQYNFINYTVQLCATSALTSDMDIGIDYKTIGDFHAALDNVISFLRERDDQIPEMRTDSLRAMHDALQEISSWAEEHRGSVPSDKIDTIGGMFSWLSSFIAAYADDVDMFFLQVSDPSLTSYLDIQLSGSNVSGEMSYGGMNQLSDLDSLVTKSGNAVNILQQNTFRIYDMTRSQYSQFKSPNAYMQCKLSGYEDNQFLGIVPVIVTPANAMFFQNLLDFRISGSVNTAAMEAFNQVNSLTAIGNLSVVLSGMHSISSDLVVPMESVADDVQGYTDVGIEAMTRTTSQESISRRASMMFPLIDYDGMSHFSRDHLKDIGVVVFKAFKDSDNNGKVGFQLLESFVGSFDKHARDPVTKANRFIDDIVNSQSKCIAMFSNIDQKMLANAATLAMSKQPAVSMGFYKVDCRKIIDYAQSIMMPLTRMLDNASNRDTLPIDIVADAGMSNIANAAYFANASDPSKLQQIDTDELPNIADSYPTSLGDLRNTGWRAVIKKLDDFVKYTRKDCMFIADGLRSFCLDGDAKIVRKTCPCNSVTKSIIPKLRSMSGLFDSSYTAGYCNWFYQQDYSSGDYFWIPPSIKAMGTYIYCDTYFQPWSAPAGLTRGVLNDVVDVAFVPSEDEAGKIYSARWNYAMSYPLDGIVIEGHKTFQSKQTALDRVNVRRLMLYLEKQTVRIARWFVYEGNTPYMRQRFVDTLRPVFEDAVRRDGVREYAIKCDDELNTTQVIENNELRCRIAVIPVKTVDYIVLDFIVSRQNASVSEEVRR